MAHIKIRGEVSKLRAWDGGFGFKLKDTEEEYGKTYDVQAEGVPTVENGDVVTVIGKPNIAWQVWKSKLTEVTKSTPAASQDNEEIPF